MEASEELLRPIKVGQSSSLRVGQQCLANGNPFGFDHTLTVGVISGLNRDIFSQTGVTIGGGVQTDAAINPGNRDICGFAIPSSTVGKIIPQLIQFGKVPRNSLAAKAGILPTTRAFAGNIVLGDIIVAVDNKPVRSKAELYKAFDDYNVGEKVLFKIQRGNENLEMPVVLEEKDSR
ncbi:protease Do-like 8, chloroplastic [Actinidia eriantha]|uniref:protease Do-like 8, chloroplastic n=1 Tax=Actinidia eriantha TaxID=165200 RepID=UPI002583D6EA|nr:protease Do-like 8, chloroplastic [Actinidia eriantha]XP_057481808.1 protease Do-like 8, chloroplastic [Actinidia eriantha]XP_057481809.1 protease Do-like 8, chloroplastic [Actinidia eriantha]XP_057481810.1 protease Do-like 8, chloroplastic [Actinidia eriantha]XP_057481811.1 protease Do-like 8, chloroplastic [Actinidia eriantha]